MTATLDQEAPESDALTFDAEHIARGWLSVALARSTDEARPALTGINIEFFERGVRLVATDSYMLLRSWVGAGDAPEPDLDEAPSRRAVALDVYGRGAGLMRHMLALATAKDAPPYDVRVSIGPDPRVDIEPSFVGFERQCAIFDVPDQELLTLPLYEGDWPDWRHLWDTWTSHTTTEVHFAPELIVARLGKLGKLHPGSTVGWSFGGPTGAAKIVLSPAEPSVEGLAMPTKVHLPDLAPDGEGPSDEDRIRNAAANG